MLNKHINFNRKPFDQIYYENLAEIVSTTASKLVIDNNISKKKFKIIDIGCGAEEVMNSLSSCGFKPTGIDIQAECASRSKEYGEVIIADIMDLTSIFQQASFELVICSHVLEHLENSTKAVEVIKWISSRWILIVVPNLSRLTNFFVRKPRYINTEHLHGWDSHHLKTFLEIRCGLKITQWITDGVVLTPLHKFFLLKSRLLHFVEYKILSFLIPQVANSLIVLCEKK